MSGVCSNAHTNMASVCRSSVPLSRQFHSVARPERHAVAHQPSHPWDVRHVSDTPSSIACDSPKSFYLDVGDSRTYYFQDFCAAVPEKTRWIYQYTPGVATPGDQGECSENATHRGGKEEETVVVRGKFMEPTSSLHDVSSGFHPASSSSVIGDGHASSLTTQHSQPDVFRTAFIVKLILLGLFVSAGIGFYMYRHAVNHWLDTIISFLGLWSPVVFIPSATLLISLLLPAELVILTAGFLFTREDTFGMRDGMIVAIIACFMALACSSAINFFACRCWLHAPTEQALQKYPLFRAFKRAVRDGGVYFVALLRLSPLVPFAISNCLLGVTDVSFLQVLAGLPCALPCKHVATVRILLFGTVVSFTVYVGSALEALRDISHPHMEWGPLRIAFLVFGGLAAGVAMCYIGYLTRKRLESLTEGDEGQNHLLPERIEIVVNPTTPS